MTGEGEVGGCGRSRSLKLAESVHIARALGVTADSLLDPPGPVHVEAEVQQGQGREGRKSEMSDDPRTAKVGEIWRRCTQNMDDGSAMSFEGPVTTISEHCIGIGKVGYWDLMARPDPDVVTETWEKLADAPATEPVVGQIYLARVCEVEDVPVRCVEDSPVEWMLLLADGCTSCGFSWHASERITDWRPASVIETSELERLRGESS